MLYNICIHHAEDDCAHLPLQGRPLKASDLIPLGPVPEASQRQAGATVPAAWRPTFPAAKDTPWKERRSWDFARP